MARRPAAADVRIALIPALAGSGSGSSSAPVQPVGKTYSVWQVVHAMYYGVPAIPVLEDGHPAGGAVELVWQAAQGRVRGVVVGTMNTYLRACGRIPEVYPEGCSWDLNTALVAHASQPQPERGHPLICAHCNFAFCFGVHEAPWLIPPLRMFFPDPPVPATADLVTPPPVRPLYANRAVQGPGASPQLVVCSNMHHFMVAMGMLKLPHDAPSLVWRRPFSLGVLPTALGSAGGSLRRYAPAPLTNANSVVPGDDEYMLQLGGVCDGRR
ncbi:hypothetical protein BAE44_0025344 [Dichanthelium oligosanthes]|uniref:Uncharacterized protein n=1 Tax=Dichanthelium oligosanthes TaxID=888268 RepID=A0A1E5ULA6_9POAL|nr:hypothetical protein BAE44_0025344 [Dichanthelium oligosanthes]